MKSIVVDNFFSDPDSVVALSKELTYKSRNPDEFFEGRRSPDLIQIYNEFYVKTVSKIIECYFDMRYCYDVEGSMFFHKLNDSDLNDPQWVNDKVHQDPYITSTIIFLSKDAPMSSGTQLYKKQGNYYHPDVIYHNKFNRMVMFPGEIPHSAMDVRGGTEDRLTLLFFLNNIKHYG